MKWVDDGIVLYKKAHQEKGWVVGVLTQNYGRWNGWLRGRTTPQLGDFVHCMWSARTQSQLGAWKLEERAHPYTLQPMDKLMALGSLCQLCHLYMPEREAYPKLFCSVTQFIQAIQDWQWAYIRFELAFLREMGFRLSLHTCALTRTTDNLAYVCPKTGCALSQEAGYENRHELLTLPPVLAKERGPTQTPISHHTYRSALQLTGHFLSEHICNHRLPSMRKMLV